MSGLVPDLYVAFDADPSPVLDFLAELVRRYELAPPLAVVDVGCGPGRMLREYHRLGWRVLALEPSDELRERAREEAASLADVEVRAGSFLDLDEVGRFDLAVAVNGPFAYLLTPAGRAEAVHRLFRALRPGGLLLLYVPDLAWLEGQLPEVGEEVADLGGVRARLRIRRSWDFESRRYTQVNEWEAEEPAGEAVRERRVDHHAILTADELATAARAAGFAGVEVFRGWRPGEESGGRGRLILVGRRPR